MPAEHTQSEDVQPGPERRLRELIDDPEGHNFLEASASGCHVHPLGFDAARKCENSDLLREYRNLCADRLPGNYFADSPMAREWAEDKYNALNRLDDRIRRLEFPPREEWPVAPEFVEFVGDLNVPTKRNRRFDRQGWERVWDTCDADDLTFIDNALTDAHGFGKAGRNRYQDVLTGLRYYHGETDIEDLLNVSKRGKGTSRRKIYANAEAVLERLDPVIGAMLIHWVTEITRKVSDSSGGRYLNGDRRLNVKSDGKIERRRERGRWNSTTAHEFGHALHHLYGFWANGDIDNRDADRNEWTWNVVKRDPHETSTTQGAFQATIRQEWEKLRAREIEPLEEYQLKNADEFIAVAFEAWVVDPDHLATEQPRMKKVFDAHFGRQDYSGMQTRLEAMPSPRRKADAVAV